MNDDGDRYVVAARAVLSRVTAFAVDHDGLGTVTVERTDASGDRWAIRRSGEVLNRVGTWEYEPLPSSRAPAFYRRTRFELVAALHRAVAHALAHSVALVRGLENDEDGPRTEERT